MQTTARKRKSLTATKARESNSRKGNFVDFCVEHSLFYAGSKFMLGFEEREDDEEEEEEDGGAWWIALLTCYLIGCDADTAPEELRPRLLQKKLVIIVICHRHSECRFLQPSGRPDGMRRESETIRSGRALCNWHFSLPRRTRKKKKQLQAPLRVASTSEQTDR